MSKIRIDEADQLQVRDVLHAKLSSLDASATIADARAYFDASRSRRQAFLLDDGRYVGSITPALLEGQDPDRPAVEVAELQRTLGLDAPATTGRDLALQTDRRRVPVVDDGDRLVGVIAVTGDLTSFCGTTERRPEMLERGAERAAEAA